MLLLLPLTAHLKICNLNPTETSTCRRCQSDSGRSTPPFWAAASLFYLIFFAFVTHTCIAGESGFYPLPSSPLVLGLFIHHLMLLLPAHCLVSDLVYHQRLWWGHSQTNQIWKQDCLFLFFQWKKNYSSENCYIYISKYPVCMKSFRFEIFLWWTRFG